MSLARNRVRRSNQGSRLNEIMRDELMITKDKDLVDIESDGDSDQEYFPKRHIHIPEAEPRNDSELADDISGVASTSRGKNGHAIKSTGSVSPEAIGVAYPDIRKPSPRVATMCSVKDCSFVGSDRKSIRLHLCRNHMKTFRCHLCGETIETENTADIESHLIKVHHNHDQISICGAGIDVGCAYTTHQPDLLEKHRSKYHSEDEFILCNVCSCKFIDEDELREHIRRRHNMTMCMNCTKLFKDRESFQNHYHIKQRVKMQDMDRKYIMSHLTIQKGRPRKRENRKEVKNRKRVVFGKSKASHTIRCRELFKCPFCSICFSSKVDANQHINFAHRNVYKCSLCKYVSLIDANILRHMEEGIHDVC